MLLEEHAPIFNKNAKKAEDRLGQACEKSSMRHILRHIWPSSIAPIHFLAQYGGNRTETCGGAAWQK